MDSSLVQILVVVVTSNVIFITAKVRERVSRELNIDAIEPVLNGILIEKKLGKMRLHFVEPIFSMKGKNVNIHLQG